MVSFLKNIFKYGIQFDSSTGGQYPFLILLTSWIPLQSVYSDLSTDTHTDTHYPCVGIPYIFLGYSNAEMYSGCS